MITPHTHAGLRYGLPLAVYVLLIFGLSSLALQPVVTTIRLPDKLYHTIEYGILPILLFRALVFLGPHRFAKYYFPTGLLAALVIAALDECYQAWIPWRSGDFFDWVADAFGIGLCAAGWQLWRRSRRQS